MGGDDPFGEQLREILDRIVEVELAEGRRGPKRTFPGTANGMA